MSSNEKPVVILIHGLHQNNWIMYPLAKQLQRAGYTTHCFNYSSVFESITQHADKLHQYLTEVLDEGQKFHIVGHSLGGLVLRETLAQHPVWQQNEQVDNCVTLGTPHAGSVTATYARKLLPFAIGQAYKGALDGNTKPLPEGITLGVIAGDKPHGLGQPILSYHNKVQALDDKDKIHDGTVYLSETKLANAKDHIILPVTHTGMLVDKEVIKQTVHFLQQGVFDRAS